MIGYEQTCRQADSRAPGNIYVNCRKAMQKAVMEASKEYQAHQAYLDLIARQCTPLHDIPLMERLERRLNL